LRPHIIHLSTVHPPDDIRILRKMCRTLAQSGYQTTCIVPARPDQTRVDDRQEGVRVCQLPPRTGRLTRIVNQFRLLRLALQMQGSLYHFHDPELIPLGILLKLLGKRVIYDVHEDVPKQILSKYWIPPRLRRIVSVAASVVESIGNLFWDGVVAATPSIARRFPPQRTVIVQNFPLREEIETGVARPFVDRQPQAIYAGAITEERGIRQIIGALALLPESRPLRLALVGNFRPATLLDEIQAEPGWQRVDNHGWCRREDVRRLTDDARAGIVTFLPSPNHVEAQPNKLFEYMSAGIPVIAADFPLWRQIVDGAGCGLLVDPHSPEQLHAAIERLVNDPQLAQEMGERGRVAVEEKFNWDVEARVLLQFYQRLLHTQDAAATRAAGSTRNHTQLEAA
jgi:glycosyltransferase involved in cell wall biosynthesis